MTFSVVKMPGVDEGDAALRRIEEDEIVSLDALAVDLLQLVVDRRLHDLVVAVEPGDDVEALVDDLHILLRDAGGIQHGEELVLVAAEPEADAVALHVLDAGDAGRCLGDIYGGAAMPELRNAHQRRTIRARRNHLVRMSDAEAVGALRTVTAGLMSGPAGSSSHLDAGLFVVALLERPERAGELPLDDPFEPHASLRHWRSTPDQDGSDGGKPGNSVGTWVTLLC